MAADDETAGRIAPDPQYRSLPQPVRLDETIASVDTDAVPDPDVVRNVDHHAALRDD